MPTIDTTSYVPYTILSKSIGSYARVAVLGIILVVVLVACATNNATMIKASGLQFSETELRAKVGQPVTLELFNVDGYGHAFDIDELNVHVELPASKTTPLTFTPNQPGTYLFYCGTYGHRSAGMVGTLIVEP
jgi:heme/copper-type cytochrome/quinol oxidase subunit 2